MLKFATVGTGWIAHEYVRGALSTGHWALAAVYSRTEERGRAFGEPFGSPKVYTSLSALAEDKELDAVYVASPNALHYEQCRFLLSAGKHVICEKPLCAQSAKVRALRALAREKGVVFMEAIMYLHQPQRKVLTEALSSIGDIRLARLDFCQRSSKLDSYLNGELPNIFNPAMETGALMDLGVYCVYPALSLFGKPTGFSIEPQMLESGADGADAIILHYPDKLVTLTCSKLGESGACTDFQGTRGTVSVGSISRLADVSIWRPDGTRTALYGSDEKYVLMGREAEDFYRYITDPTATEAEYRECAALALSVSELMEALRAAGGIRFPSDPPEAE